MVDLHFKNDGRGGSADPASGAAVDLHLEGKADRDFVLSLFSSVHAPALSASGLPPQAVDQLVAMQFRAQAASFAGRFPDARRLIMRRDGASVGRVIVEAEAADLYVVDIAVCPQVQGRGIGGAALAALQREASAAGLGVRALVMPHNGPSLSMFRRRGFVETGRVADPSLELRWTA